MEQTCVNLAERFGERFRISWDEAYDVHGTHHDKRDPWMMQIPCARGTIYPHGGDRLAVEVDGRPITAKKIAALPGVICVQDGEREKTYTFTLDVFEQVVALVVPRKKRHLSPENREAAVERLAEYRRKSSPDDSQDAPVAPDAS